MVLNKTMHGKGIDRDKRRCLYNRMPRWLLPVLTALVAVLCYVHFSHMGFTCGDDLENYLITRQGWGACVEHAQGLAAQQGRFYFLVAQPCYDLPWAVDDWGYTHVLQYGMLLVSYLLFARLLLVMWGSQPLAWLTLLLLIVQTPITGNNHMPFMAYPFVFAFSCSLMWVALTQYVRYCQKGDRWRLWLGSALFFAAALFYETYVLFLALLCLFAVVRHWRRDGFVAMWRKGDFYGELLPFVTAGLCYVALYVAYRSHQLHLHPDAAFYTGASMSDEFSVAHFFRILQRCTQIVMPMKNFLLYHTECTVNYFGDNAADSVLFALRHASARVYVVAVVAGGLLYWLMERMEVGRWSVRRIVAVMGVALAAAFLSHTLIAVTPKYNNDWYAWMQGYVTSYFSFFGIVLVLAMLAVLMLTLFRDKPVLDRWARLGMVGVAMCVLVVEGYTNENLSHEWQRSQSRFEEIDRLHDEGAFLALPEEAVVYTGELYASSVWGSSMTKENDFIDQYIRMRTGLDLHCANSQASLESLREQHPDAPVYVLRQVEPPRCACVEVSLEKSLL